jgi:hypothetical protein
VDEFDKSMVAIRKNIYNALFQGKESAADSGYISRVVVGLVTLAFNLHVITLGRSKESFIKFVNEGKDLLEDTLPSKKTSSAQTKKKIIN